MCKGMRLVAVVLALTLLGSLLITGGCQPSEEQYRKPAPRQTIGVYSFSVEEEVMTEEVFPAF